MVHVNVGTGNAVNGIINAAHDNVPILFTAGRTPLTEEGLPGTRDLYIHWAQESFDQAGMVREYVKWDYELRNFTQLEAVVDRALEIAMAPPRGPVYLTLPREVLAEPQVEFTMASPPRRHLGGCLGLRRDGRLRRRADPGYAVLVLERRRRLGDPHPQVSVVLDV